MCCMCSCDYEDQSIINVLCIVFIVKNQLTKTNITKNLQFCKFYFWADTIFLGLVKIFVRLVGLVDVGFY